MTRGLLSRTTASRMGRMDCSVDTCKRKKGQDGEKAQEGDCNEEEELKD